jgi:hypothetical protein
MEPGATPAETTEIVETSEKKIEKSKMPRLTKHIFKSHDTAGILRGTNLNSGCEGAFSTDFRWRAVWLYLAHDLDVAQCLSVSQKFSIYRPIARTRKVRKLSSNGRHVGGQASM